MNTLFPSPSIPQRPTIHRDAAFSGDRLHRFWLKRSWDDMRGPARLCFIGLNPSTADAHEDDQTIRRVVHFARREGYRELVMLNLFSLVSTDPKALLTHPDPTCGGLADQWLRDMVTGNVVFCWGAFPQAAERAAQVAAMFPRALCLGKTKEGRPKHPCRLGNNTPLITFHA